jgi:hypothetical protein
MAKIFLILCNKLLTNHVILLDGDFKRIANIFIKTF